LKKSPELSQVNDTLQKYKSFVQMYLLILALLEMAKMHDRTDGLDDRTEGLDDRNCSLDDRNCSLDDRTDGLDDRTEGLDDRNDSLGVDELDPIGDLLDELFLVEFLAKGSAALPVKMAAAAEFSSCNIRHVLLSAVGLIIL